MSDNSILSHLVVGDSDFALLLEVFCDKVLGDGDMFACHVFP